MFYNYKIFYLNMQIINGDNKTIKINTWIFYKDQQNLFD